MVGGARLRKLPLGSYLNKPKSRNISRKSSPIESWKTHWVCKTPIGLQNCNWFLDIFYENLGRGNIAQTQNLKSPKAHERMNSG